MTVDDAACDPVLDHHPCGSLGAQQNVSKVGAVQRIPTVLGRLEQRRRKHAACVVDQHRHRAEFGDGAGQGRVYLGGVAHVGDDAESAAGLGGGGAGLRIALPDRHPRSEGRQTLGDPATDPRSAAGDHGDPSRQKHRTRIDRHCVRLVRRSCPIHSRRDDHQSPNVRRRPSPEVLPSARPRDTGSRRRARRGGVAGRQHAGVRHRRGHRGDAPGVDGADRAGTGRDRLRAQWTWRGGRSVRTTHCGRVFRTARAVVIANGQRRDRRIGEGPYLTLQVRLIGTVARLDQPVSWATCCTDVPSASAEVTCRSAASDHGAVSIRCGRDASSPAIAARSV